MSRANTRPCSAGTPLDTAGVWTSLATPSREPPCADALTVAEVIRRASTVEIGWQEVKSMTQYFYLLYDSRLGSLSHDGSTQTDAEDLSWWWEKGYLFVCMDYLAFAKTHNCNSWRFVFLQISKWSRAEPKWGVSSSSYPVFAELYTLLL